MQADELKFDTMVVNTTLAEEYLLQHPELNDPEQFNTIPSSRNETQLENHQTLEWFDIVTNLVKLVEENKRLFCQLEYLKRKIPMKQVEEYDLKLLVNHLLCCRDWDVNFKMSREQSDTNLVMDEYAPLAMLGAWMPQFCIRNGNTAIIQSCEKTAAICHLFLHLCFQAGLPRLTLRIEEIPRNTLTNTRVSETINACLGIITNRSDIDSAVDVFLQSPTNGQWAVYAILIEESAVDKFKKAISWKTRNHEKIDPDISRQCTASYSFDGKLFLFEYVGKRPIDKRAVLIDTYRTVKDLLSIARPSLSVSLWASDVAESNEIAHNIDSNIVWINDFGNFNGPKETSQAFFSTLKGINDSFSINMTEKIGKVLEVQSAWLKLDVFKRAEVIRKLLNKKVDLSHFVHVDRTFMCVGKTLPKGVLYIENDLNDVAKVVTLGNGLLVQNEVAEKNDVYYKLREAGAPVEIVDKIDCSPGAVKLFKGPAYDFYKTKVIWTSYGTIFAN